MGRSSEIFAGKNKRHPFCGNASAKCCESVMQSKYALALAALAAVAVTVPVFMVRNQQNPCGGDLARTDTGGLRGALQALRSALFARVCATSSRQRVLRCAAPGERRESN